MSIQSIRARLARAGLHQPIAWLRNFGLDPNDVFIASHGRSGDTMLRFPLGEVLSGIPTTFDNIQQIVPEIGVHGKAYTILPGQGRLIKTHEPYNRKYTRAIYLIRDLRDALLSFFARETAVRAIHPKYKSLDDYIPAFLQGKVSHFGSWQAHVEGWMNSPLAQRGDLLVVRFEDMRRDRFGTLVRCMDFLGKPVDSSAVETAIRNNSLEKMREKEDQAEKFPKAPGEEGRHVGRGAIEGWRQKLSPRQAQIVDEYASDILKRFGYATGATSYSAGNPASGTQVTEAYLGELTDIPEAHPRVITNHSGQRALRVRMGGEIANLFSWYRY